MGGRTSGKNDTDRYELDRSIQASRRGGQTKSTGSKPIAKNGLPVCVLPNKAPVPDRPNVRSDQTDPSNVFSCCEKQVHAVALRTTLHDQSMILAQHLKVPAVTMLEDRPIPTSHSTRAGAHLWSIEPRLPLATARRGHGRPAQEVETLECGTVDLSRSCALGSLRMRARGVVLRRCVSCSGCSVRWYGHHGVRPRPGLRPVMPCSSPAMQMNGVSHVAGAVAGWRVFAR